MIRGLFDKTWRETRVVLGVASIAVLLFATLLAYVLPQFREGISDFILEVPFMRTMIQSSMGIDVAAGLTVQMLLAVVWTHPVMLATLWATGVVLATRFPAGEIDRGTIEILLGWPVSRRTIYSVETLMWLAGGCALVLAILAGYSLGLMTLPAAERPPIGPVLLVAINMLCLHIAVGGIGFIVSSLSDRRGRAFGVVFGILIVSYLITFLAGIWEPAQSVAFLSIMEYHRPAEVIHENALPLADLAVLLGIGGATWFAGLEISARRSITAT